ncbi:hypothetical protein C8T65DRAFT_742052 [Cerioporus squamosus]|nr:hypothetical protein C8T65DRAFT_742052 [Cerioporus squamosus]
MAWASHKQVCRSGSAVVLAKAPPPNDAWNSLNERSALYNDALRHCSECDQPPTDGKKLRKCAGCATLYCSSACQKKAWSKHKAICRPKDGAGQSKVVYVSSGSHIQEFLNAHYYTFHAIAYSMALLHCQALRAVSPASVELPRFLRFCDNFPDMEPSMREHPLLWERAEALRAEAVRAFSRTQGSALHWRLSTYYVPESNVAGVMKWFPLAAPLPTLPHDPATTTVVLHDMINVCVNSINMGFPLRTTKHRALDYALSHIKSGRSIPMLFHFLHAQQGIIEEDENREALRRMGISESSISLLIALGAVLNRPNPAS